MPEGGAGVTELFGPGAVRIGFAQVHQEFFASIFLIIDRYLAHYFRRARENRKLSLNLLRFWNDLSATPTRRGHKAMTLIARLTFITAFALGATAAAVVATAAPTHTSLAVPAVQGGG